MAVQILLDVTERSSTKSTPGQQKAKQSFDEGILTWRAADAVSNERLHKNVYYY